MYITCVEYMYYMCKTTQINHKTPYVYCMCKAIHVLQDLHVQYMCMALIIAKQVTDLQLEIAYMYASLPVVIKIFEVLYQSPILRLEFIHTCKTCVILHKYDLSVYTQ